MLQDEHYVRMRQRSIGHDSGNFRNRVFLDRVSKLYNSGISPDLFQDVHVCVLL
jgi:hypothetical protein